MSGLTPPVWPANEDEAGVHRQVVEALDQGVYFVDRERTIKYWSPGATRISGHEPDDVVGRRCYDNILNHVDETGRVLCFGACPLAGTIEDGQPRDARIFLRHEEGHRVAVDIRASAIRNAEGEIIGAAEVFHTVQSRDLAPHEAEELRRLAFVDDLTGLPNRRLTERAVGGRLASLERHGWSFGLLLCDLDDLKLINDRYGHAAGDVALRVAARTLDNARAEDLVGRWGGDEFVVVVADGNEVGLARVAGRIAALVSRSRAEHEGSRLPLGISIGGTLARPGDTIDDLVRRADVALYRAKDGGRGRFELWDDAALPALRVHANRRRSTQALPTDHREDGKANAGAEGDGDALPEA